MKDLQISIKPIKQVNPNSCSIACLIMVLDYYGIEVSHKEILNFIIKATPGGSSFVSEIARFAKSKGFKVDCHAYNLYLTDPKDAHLSKKKLLEKLEKELNDSRRDKYYDLMLESTIKGIKEGVNYIIKKPNFRIIKSYLTRSIPLIVTVNYAALHDRQGDPFESHDIVLCGLEGETVYFVDPEHAKVESIDSSDLMFAFLQRKVISGSAYLLAVLK